MALSQHNITTPLLQFLQNAFDNLSLRYHALPTPLAGGYSSFLFKFQLRTSGVLGQPLVIRLCPATTFPAGQAFIEGEIQNLLYAERYPTAPVHIICEDTAILGHEFLIMRFMPGEMMIHAYPFEEIPTQLALAHTQLHLMDMNIITPKLRLKGFYTRQHLGIFTTKFAQLIDNVESRIAARELTYLMPALDWIHQHRSIVGRIMLINHGDFHHQNILIDQGRISAVLDWQGWKLGEPEYDVTNTMVKLHCFAPVLQPQYDWSGFIKRYVATYHDLYPLGTEKLRYYQAVWCIRFYVMILDMPRVNHPQIKNRLFNHFEAITGIEITG